MKCCLISILCLLFCCKSRAQGKFRVEGTIPSIHNGKYIYLWGIDYSKMNPVINDSSLIKNGTFQFAGTLHTPALLASLYLNDIRDYFTQFYVEPKVMKLKAIPRNINRPISTAEIHNSPVNDQYKEWKQETDSIQTESVKLYPLIDSLSKSETDSAKRRLMQEKQNILKELILSKQIELVRNHPQWYLSLYWLSYKIVGSSLSKPMLLKELFASLDTALQKLPEGKALKKVIADISAIQPGHKLPEFLMPDSNGVNYSPGQFKGKYLLLDFWASWCKPCLEKIPELKKLYNQYHKRGLEVAGISIDYNRESWLKSLRFYQLPWVQLSQLRGWDSPIVQEFNITYLPKTILVDADRNIIAIDPVLPVKLKELLP